jgi:DNA-binding IclR family transcriptional regulator
MSGSMGIRVDELEAELARLQQLPCDGPQGFTVQELAKAWGITLSGVRLRLRGLAERGLLQCAGRRRAVRIDGSATQVPVYRLTRPRKRRA